MLEVTTRTGTVYVLHNGRMERLPISPFTAPELDSIGILYGDPFKLHTPLAIGASMRAHVYGLGNIRTSPVTSIVEYRDNGTTFHRSDTEPVVDIGLCQGDQDGFCDLHGWNACGWNAC